MKLVLHQRISGGPDAAIHPGIILGDTVIDFDEVVGNLDHYSPQHLMNAVISNFEVLRSDLETLSRTATGTPLADVRLTSPLPRPGKILCCIGNYWEHMQRDARPLNMFLKNPDAVIGPGGTVTLPRFTEPYVFHHEAELAIVIKGPSKEIGQMEHMKAIFGYTCLIDVSARAEGRSTWRQGSWMGKSFDTFAPIGPCIVTADEVVDPNDLEIRFWNNGELMHEYNTSDMEHRVPELIEFATTIMTLNSGDVIACGTNHEGLGPLQDNDTIEIEGQHIGRMSVNIVDPLKRNWTRGIYMGPNSTAPAAQSNQRA